MGAFSHQVINFSFHCRNRWGCNSPNSWRTSGDWRGYVFQANSTNSHLFVVMEYYKNNAECDSLPKLFFTNDCNEFLNKATKALFRQRPSPDKTAKSRCVLILIACLQGNTWLHENAIMKILHGGNGLPNRQFTCRTTPRFGHIHTGTSEVGCFQPWCFYPSVKLPLHNMQITFLSICLLAIRLFPPNLLNLNTLFFIKQINWSYGYATKQVLYRYKPR